MDLLGRTKAVLKALLISSYKTMYVEDLDRDYSKFEGHKIPFHQLGYSNLIIFLVSIPDTLTIDPKSGIISPVISSQVQHMQQLISPPTTLTWDIDLGYQYQRPHPRIKLEYSPLFKPKLDVTIPVLDDKPLEMSRNPSSENEEREKDVPTLDNKEIKDPNATANENEISEEGGPEPDALPLLNDDDPIHSLGLPMLDIGTRIENPSLKFIEPGHTYNIFVTEINRPWKFWFRFCDRDDIEVMEELMLHFDEEKVPMEESLMNIGTACVVLYQKKWMRGEIVEKPTYDEITVCLVDYGTIVDVDISQCYHLNNDLASIPKLCYPGALEFIEPIDNPDIEMKLVELFCEMVANKPLAGFVDKVDQQNQIIRLVLIDTSSPNKDVIVNRDLMALYESNE